MKRKKIDQKVYMLFSGGTTLKNQNISYKDVGRGKFETNSFWILCKTLMWCLDRADSLKLDTEHVMVLNFVSIVENDEDRKIYYTINHLL